MSKVRIINHCPRCGGDCKSIKYGDLDNNCCPYCGHELYDYSEIKNQLEIERVKAEKKKLFGVPRTVAITIIATILVVLAIIAFLSVSGATSSAGYYFLTAGANSYTKKMAKCYEKEDWDKLYKIVIEDCEHSINSPAYFTYRTAWILSCYPEDFDAAYEAGDIDEMKSIYKFIREDYNMRNDKSFFAIYETVDEIEAELVKEYEREKSIMDSLEEKDAM